MRKKITGTFGLKIFSTGLSLITSIFLARLLGKANYGIYTYTNTWLVLLGVFGGLGLRNIVIRQIAIYRASSEQQSLLLGLIDWTNKVVLLFSIIIVVISSIIVLIFIFNFNKQLAIAFWITLVILPFQCLISLRQGIMQGFDKLIIGQLPETTIQPILFLILLVISLLFFRNDQSVSVVISIKLLTTIVSFVAGSIILSKTIFLFCKKKSFEYHSSSWSKSILPFLLIGCTHIINNKTDTLMLGFIHGTQSVGIYFVSSRAAEIVSFILVAVNMTIAPIIANLYVEKQNIKLQQLIVKSSRLTFFSSLIVGGSLIIFGNWFLLLFGAEFTQGHTTLIILCTAQIFSSFFGSVGILLDMTGNEKFSAIGIGISSFLNIILNAIFIPIWGMEGASVATAISICIWNVYLVICARRKLKITPNPIFLFK